MVDPQGPYVIGTPPSQQAQAQGFISSCSGSYDWILRLEVYYGSAWHTVTETSGTNNSGDQFVYTNFAYCGPGYQARSFLYVNEYGQGAQSQASAAVFCD